MKDNRIIDLSAIKNLRDEFNNLKEKVANTTKVKRQLLQSKCELGLKKVSDFIKVYKPDAKAALKVSVLAALIFTTGAIQFQVTMNKQEYEISPNLQAKSSIVTEVSDYGLANPSDVVKINKDFFEALDETKNIVEEVQKLAKGISTVQKTREYSKNSSAVESSSLEDKYQLINALAEKLRLNKKTKEKKELNKERDLDNQYEKIELDSSSNRDLDISIIEEVDGDKPLKIEKIDIDGDGIEDDVYIVDIKELSDEPFKAVCYNTDKEIDKSPEIEEYER